MVRMSSENVKSEDDIQGSERPLPGRYHVVIKDVTPMVKEKDENGNDKWFDCEEDQAGKLVINFEVLAGTTPGQAGREVAEHFHLSEKALPRLQRLALAVGLLQPNQPETDVVFANAIGRQLVVEVEENKYTNRSGQEVTGGRVSFLGIWSLGNKAVEDVPKDADAIKLAARTGTPTAAKATAAPAATAASSSDNKWADL